MLVSAGSQARNMHQDGSGFGIGQQGEAGKNCRWLIEKVWIASKKRMGEIGILCFCWGLRYASQVTLVVKNPPADAGDSCSIPGSRRSVREGKGNPLQFSCLGTLMDRGAWRATVHGVTKSRTGLKRISTQHWPKNLACLLPTCLRYEF